MVQKPQPRIRAGEKERLRPNSQTDDKPRPQLSLLDLMQNYNARISTSLVPRPILAAADGYITATREMAPSGDVIHPQLRVWVWVRDYITTYSNARLMS